MTTYSNPRMQATIKDWPHGSTSQSGNNPRSMESEMTMKEYLDAQGAIWAEFHRAVRAGREAYWAAPGAATRPAEATATVDRDSALAELTKLRPAG